MLKACSKLRSSRRPICSSFCFVRGGLGGGWGGVGGWGVGVGFGGVGGGGLGVGLGVGGGGIHANQ